MSSFIVDKVEFIKAAGLMYGIEDAKLHKHEYFLQHVRYYFVNAYKANVKSVNLQYGDNVAEDKNEYSDVFELYKIKGGQIYNGNGNEGIKNIEQLRPKLVHFFRSVLYQIEDSDLNEYASWLFFMCACKLYENTLRNVEGWLGEVEI